MCFHLPLYSSRVQTIQVHTLGCFFLLMSLNVEQTVQKLFFYWFGNTLLLIIPTNLSFVFFLALKPGMEQTCKPSPRTPAWVCAFVCVLLPPCTLASSHTSSVSFCLRTRSLCPGIRLQVSLSPLQGHRGHICGWLLVNHSVARNLI